MITHQPRRRDALRLLAAAGSPGCVAVLGACARAAGPVAGAVGGGTADVATDPAATGGRFVVLPPVPSAHAAPRQVTVWLPPGHDRGNARLPVLYMHDGQNLFHAADAYGGQTWGVAPALAALQTAGRVAPTIVVGIWNTPLRSREYGPDAPLERLPAAWRDAVYGGPPLSTGYLRWLVDELKPRIDRHFRTLTGPAHTRVMGSSMGGLISLEALVRHPGVFGGAGCVSTHWPMSTNPAWIRPPGDPRAAQAQQALRDWLAQALPAPGAHRLWFDHGTAGLDALYPPLQARVDAVLAARGWRAGVDFTSRRYDGADHNEASWRARIHDVLPWLLST